MMVMIESSIFRANLQEKEKEGKKLIRDIKRKRERKNFQRREKKGRREKKVMAVVVEQVERGR